MKQQHFSYIIVLLLILLGLSARLLPHPANFAPIGAIAIFGGFYLPRKFAIIIPLAALFVSDIFIGFYNPKMMVAVYGAFACMGAIALLARKRKSFTTVLGAILVGSILFFLITNAAVWMFGTMYPLTAAGLLESYTMAIPFFKNSLMGDLFYTGVLVGSMEMLLYKQRKMFSEQATHIN